MYASTDVLANIEFVYKTIHSHIRLYTYNKLPPPVALTPLQESMLGLTHVLLFYIVIICSILYKYIIKLYYFTILLCSSSAIYEVRV